MQNTSLSSNFEKIIEFHKAFGLEYHDTHQKDFFSKTKLVKLRLDLIQEEFDELKEAIKNKDFTEVRDAIGDILYVVYGAAASFGIEANKDYELIHNSNMSKLCVSEEEAKETVEWYQNKYSKNELPYDSPCFRKSNDGKYWVVYNKSSGKILKSINYTQVNFNK